jgi:hypothetical protein
MMIIKRIEYVSNSKYDPISTDFWACGNHDLSFSVDSLKSPFVKGDLGGFSTASEIPPYPPLPKGGKGKDALRFPFSTHRASRRVSRSSFNKRLKEVMDPGIRAFLMLLIHPLKTLKDLYKRGAGGDLSES